MGVGQGVSEAAEFVDPDDVDDIARGLARVLTNPSHRGALIQRGRVQACLRTWQETARATLVCHAEALTGPCSR